MIVLVNSMIAIHIEKVKSIYGEEVIIREDFNEIDNEMAQAEIVVGLGPTLKTLTSEKIDKFKNLKWIHADTAGVDSIPVEKIAEKKITVTNSRGIHGTQMSEHIIGMMLCFSRGLHNNLRNQMRLKWDRSYPVQELSGKTLCIIGPGRIGKELAKKAKVFDMKVIGLKRKEEELENFDTVYTIDYLTDVLKEADYVTVLTPLTPETFHMIGEKEFKAMKSSAIFLNFARGEVVDEKAMIQALVSKEITGAGLDVFEQEPLPQESPLWQMENVLISPHHSGLSPTQDVRKYHVFKELYIDYKEKRELKFAINLEDLK